MCVCVCVCVCISHSCSSPKFACFFLLHLLLLNLSSGLPYTCFLRLSRLYIHHAPSCYLVFFSRYSRFSHFHLAFPINFMFFEFLVRSNNYSFCFTRSFFFLFFSPPLVVCPHVLLQLTPPPYLLILFTFLSSSPCIIQRLMIFRNSIKTRYSMLL